jgi:hypothetical protein
LRKKAAVDFDGVLHSFELGWYDGTIYGTMLPGAMDGLQELWDHNVGIIIFTCRVLDIYPGDENYKIVPDRVQDILDWIDSYREPQHTFEIDRVTAIKPPDASVILDDRAVRFLTWKQAVIDVKYHMPVDCESCSGKGLDDGSPCWQCGAQATQ